MMRRIKDTSDRTDGADRRDAVLDAVERYSKDRPLYRDAKLIGDGTKKVFATPSDWLDDFSILKQIEFPIDEVPPNFFLVFEDEAVVVQRSNVEQIMLLAITLKNLEELRILYIVPHTVDDSSSTIRTSDENAVANLSAANLCSTLAGFYAESTDDNIVVDVVDHAAKSTIFSDLQVTFEKKYQEHIDAGETSGPVIMHSDRDVRFSWGQDLLTHPKRNR